MAFETSSILALANLLKEPNDNSDSDDEKPNLGTARLGPGHIGLSQKKENTTHKKDLNDSKEIWQKEEIVEGSEFDSLSDSRPQPEYEIFYKQAVCTEDIYLQMGNKTPNTSSCENMVVKIKLPTTEKKDITVDVKSKFLDVRTPKYKLGLHLPHSVEEKHSNAEWNSDEESLIVTLKIIREYDFLNF